MTKHEYIDKIYFHQLLAATCYGMAKLNGEIDEGAEKVVGSLVCRLQRLLDTATHKRGLKITVL